MDLPTKDSPEGKFGQNGEILVLDKGYVRLVDFMGTDASVIRAARVSHGRDHDAPKVGGDLDERDRKLLNYLWSHHHTTPFEAVTVTFEVKVPIFIVRQWHRHRTQSYNEISARYTELPDEFYIPNPRMIGEQSSMNKQARVLTGEASEARNFEVELYQSHCEAAFGLYHQLLDAGWPRELARMCLPVSTYSRMYTTMNLLNCLKFLTLRVDAHAQWEVQQYGNAIVELLRTFVPEAVRVWEESCART